MSEEKLNKREKYKARLRPIDYYKEFEDLDFESLGEGDRFYLQDFGIFNTISFPSSSMGMNTIF